MELTTILLSIVNLLKLSKNLIKKKEFESVHKGDVNINIINNSGTINTTIHNPN